MWGSPKVTPSFRGTSQFSKSLGVMARGYFHSATAAPSAAPAMSKHDITSWTAGLAGTILPMIGGSVTYLGGLPHSPGLVVLSFRAPRRSIQSVFAIGSLRCLVVSVVRGVNQDVGKRYIFRGEKGFGGPMPSAE